MENPNLHDRYQLTQLLGRKSGRRTWLAIDQQTQDPVVIKLLLFSADFEWDALKLFEREAQTLKHLDHPAIPDYLDWFELEWEGSSGFALVQTYIPALSLEAIVRSGRTFSSEDLQQIAEQVLDILDYLHSRNPAVIHRDLKPSNILLGDRTGNSPGKVSLVDFGAVQNLAASRGGTMTIVGTYGYMPMEQFGDRAVPASDLYSLGATMLYLATGKDPADWLIDDSQLAIDDLPGLTLELNTWIRQLTQMSLRDRPASVQAARQLLRQAPVKRPPPKVASDLGRSPTLNLATRTAPPGGKRFHPHTATDDCWVFSFSNARFSIQPLPKPPSLHRSMIRIISAIILAPILAVVSLMIIYWFFQLGWGAWCAGLGWLGIAKTISQKQNRRYRAICISPSHIMLSSATPLDSAKLSAQYGETLAHVFGTPKVAWVHEPSLDRQYPKHKAWEIEYYCDSSNYQNNVTGSKYYSSDSFLKLKISDQIWHFTGTSREMRWLLGELSHHLQIPGTRYIPPESGEYGNISAL